MSQLKMEYETFATEEEIARLREAFKLACHAVHKMGCVEYRTDPKGTYHSGDEWMTYFMEIAKGREPKFIEVAFAVDPAYQTYNEWE